MTEPPAGGPGPAAGRIRGLPGRLVGGSDPDDAAEAVVAREPTDIPALILANPVVDQQVRARGIAVGLPEEVRRRAGRYR
jgi:hypothetical protein